MLSEEENDELLAVTATNSGSASKIPNLTDQLKELSQLQESKTDTLLKKVWEFIKIQLLGHTNTFEQFVNEIEPNDCSLVSKYGEVTDIDLRGETSISIDEVTLSTIHIPHPLTNFMRNEANQISLNMDILKELEESPILVFLHGLGGQMSQFEPLMGLLSQCLEIVSLDLPGFGNSKVQFSDVKMITDMSDETKLKISSSVGKMQWNDFTTENIVNIICAFINQQIPLDKKVVLFGHSMGTHLSVKVAKKLPAHKVEGLILLSPPGLIDDVTKTAREQPAKTISMLKIFNYLPWFFNCFRVWDRLEGLNSKSVSRQLAKPTDIPTTTSCKFNPNANIYNKLRQLRWNMDINSHIILKYVHGFQKAKYSDLLAAISNFNNNPSDKTTYEKTLLIAGSGDQVTPSSVISVIDKFLASTFDRKVSSSIEINNAGHSLLLSKPEFISGMILNHVELKFPERLHLAPAWVLRVKADISGDKWGLKNELKWLKLKPLSSNITRKNGKDIAPLLGMKTLREDDSNHSPALLEKKFYDPNSESVDDIEGKLIGIVDISADIPPYSPKSFKHIQYYKCATVSKVVPDQVAIRRFIQLIDDILSSNTEKAPLIAIHCHYGFNRTGFLICCYLVERLGWSVQEAVEGFKAAKPPGIKHPHFIDALYVRYESNY